MKSLENICQQLKSGQFDLTGHSLKRIVERNISRQEIMDTGNNVIIIEEYPDDKYTPSCLLLGFTQENRPLHIQTSRLYSPRTTIITLYEPNKSEWINYSKRRKKMFNCYNCGSEKFTSQLVNETFEIEGKFILVENIPAQVCSRCGEIIFSSETAETVRLMVQGETKPIK